MKIEPNTFIEIRPAANGFMVVGARPWGRKGEEVLDESSFMVFQSFEELSKWLSEHFTYRNTSVRGDVE